MWADVVRPDLPRPEGPVVSDGVRSDRVEKRVGKAPKESTADCANGDLA